MESGSEKQLHKIIIIIIIIIGTYLGDTDSSSANPYFGRRK